MPAGAGTPRYEKPELWLGTANWHDWILPSQVPNPAVDRPPRYIFSVRHRPSVYNSAGFVGGEPASRLIGGHIPDRSSGRGFLPMAVTRLISLSLNSSAVAILVAQPVKRQENCLIMAHQAVGFAEKDA